MTIQTIVGIVLLTLLILLALAALIWWLRREADPARRSFRGSVRRFEREIGAEDRYQTPWVLAVGDRVRNVEALCASLQLKSEGEANWFGRWWYGGDGAVLVIPDDMFSHPEGALAPLSAWRRLLGVLLRSRAARPLDALIWTVSASQLWSEHLAVSAGLAAAKKFADLQRRLGLSLPIYLVVTETEQAPGFLELAQALPREARDAMLGWSSPYAASAAYQSDWIEQALTRLRLTLSETIAEFGALQGGMSTDLYLLPRSFEAVRANLQALCDPVFRGNALGEAPQLRGIYFTGAQAAPEGDLEDTAAPPALPLFAGRLLRQRVLAEQGLAQPVPRILRLRQRWHRWTLIGMGLFAALWLAGISWYWHTATDDADALGRQLRILQLDRGGPRPELGNDAAARQSVVAFWRALKDAPSRRFGTLLLPTSLMSPVDGRIDDTIEYALRRAVMQPLQQRLLRDAEQVRRLGEAGSDSVSDDTAAPEKWPAYLLARQLAGDAGRLEQRVSQFNHAVNDGNATLDEAADLANGLFGLSLRAPQNAQRDNLRRILLASDRLVAAPIDLAKIRPQVGDHFSALMQAWLGQLYTNQTFDLTAQQLQKQLQMLESGQGNSLADLDSIAARIGLLQSLVNATNSAWSRAAGQDLVPGYSAMLDGARRSSLIGRDAVARVVDYSAVARQDFRKRWLGGVGASSALLAQGPSGGLELQDAVLKLNVTLASLLKLDFVASARAKAEAGLGDLANMNADAMTAALRHYDGYQKYLAGSAGQMPPAYRKGLERALQDSAARAMWAELSSRHPEPSSDQTGGSVGEGNAFDAQAKAATPLLAAMDELSQTALRGKLMAEMDRRALQSLRHAERSLQGLAVYQPLQGSFRWWDGSRNAGARAFRAGGARELQQYLGSQLELIGTLSQAQAPTLNWLLSHKSEMSVGDQQLVQRWQSASNELRHYKEKAANSAPTVLETMISKDFNEMDVGNCRNVLDQVELPAAGNIFAERAQTLVSLASDRCGVLRSQAGAGAYQKLAVFFNQYLANRFPFAAKLGAPDAAPERVAEFMRLMDDNGALAAAGLQDLKSGQAQAARRFLDAAKAARGWLGPMFTRENGGPWQGVDVEVRWRTDREHEQAADQVIEWTLASGGQRLRYPGGDGQRLHWNIGQPVTATLRWAKESQQAPEEDSTQSGLTVFDRLASWNYGGQWALLRLLRENNSPLRVNNAEGFNDVGLMLALPVRNPALQGSGNAQMFMRLTLQAPGGKSGLAVASLPYTAPPSPFRTAANPRLAAIEGS